MEPPPPLAAEKVAVTERAWDIVTLHAAVPVQAPVQPLNWKPVPGWAVNDTTELEGKFDVHVPLVQLMPAGLLVTVPVPVTATDSATGAAGGLLGLPVVEATKLAETDFAESIETLHAEVPVQAPDHPAKLKPDEGVAVSVRLVPALNEAEQLAPQLMPEGELATTPPAEDVTTRE